MQCVSEGCKISSKVSVLCPKDRLIPPWSRHYQHGDLLQNQSRSSQGRDSVVGEWLVLICCWVDMAFYIIQEHRLVRTAYHWCDIETYALVNLKYITRLRVMWINAKKCMKEHSSWVDGADPRQHNNVYTKMKLQERVICLRAWKHF